MVVVKREDLLSRSYHSPMFLTRLFQIFQLVLNWLQVLNFGAIVVV